MSLFVVLHTLEVQNKKCQNMYFYPNIGYEGNQKKVGEMARASNTHGRNEKCI